MTSQTVIVMTHNGLGDVVTTLPLLDRIDRALAPDGKLIVVAKSALEESFLRLFPWRHAPQIVTIGTDRSFAGIRHILGLALRLRGAGPDVFLAGVTPNGLAASLFARLVGARVSVGQEGKWRKLGYTLGHVWPEGEHKVSYYARFSDVGGLTTPGDLPAFPKPRIDPAGLARDGKRLILLAPGSGAAEAHKRWPAQSFADLARRLLDASSDIRIGIFGSAQEAALLQEIATDIGNRTNCEIMAASRIEDSLRIVRDAACVVSGCSGTLHLAALMNRPLVGIYGPTNPSITGPYSDKTAIVRLGLMCSPCYHPWFTTGCGSPVCMTAIDAARVQKAVLEVLEGRYKPYPRDVRTTNATAPALPQD